MRMLLKHISIDVEDGWKKDLDSIKREQKTTMVRFFEEEEKSNGEFSEEEANSNGEFFEEEAKSEVLERE